MSELRRVAAEREPQAITSGTLGDKEKSIRAQNRPAETSEVAILTGGADRPYALGLAFALMAEEIPFDFITSDEVDDVALHQSSRVRFLNLRGDQSRRASRAAKIVRVLRYYIRLLRYAATAKPLLFHILWNNKFEAFDRTILILYYKLLGKRIALTAHNVNARKRDGNDSWLNRLTLRIQYRLVDHVFVHTTKAKKEMETDFGVPAGKISVIPFGINNTVPNTALTPTQARQRLGISESDKVMLFFGSIVPYKGLKFLISAFAKLSREREDYRLIVAGRRKGTERYWEEQKREIARHGIENRVTARIAYIPDEETELFFKAADVLILPYTCIFQSGVMFLGYGFGLPVIAADVGSLKEEIIEGETGFVFKAEDVSDLANTIRRYFDSDLFRELDQRGRWIQRYANERYSWAKVAAITTTVYSNLLSSPR
jgi:glycosyltransferase involved in cell wall biosynthesis